jgi:molybdenum cofactor cytidylyltransferase
MSALRFAVVILGAGASSRMGQPKLLLPWGATSIIGHLISQWQRLKAEQIGVVCAEDQPALHAELDRLGFPKACRILNPEPARGMFSSIQCASPWKGWRAGLSHWAVALGDQPHLTETTLKALLKFAASRPQKICQPLWQNHRRHPVIFPAAVFAELGSASEADLKTFLEARSTWRAYCELDDSGLGVDLDLPADYEKAIAAFRPNISSNQPRNNANPRE